MKTNRKTITIRFGLNAKHFICATLNGITRERKVIKKFRTLSNEKRGKFASNSSESLIERFIKYFNAETCYVRRKIDARL